MEIPAEILKLKLKKLTCRKCNSRSKKGKPYCYVHKKMIQLDDEACRSISVIET